MDHWKIIQDQAQKHFDSATVWSSLGEHVKYKLKSVGPDKLTIVRCNGGEDAIIGIAGAVRSIERLKKAGHLEKRYFITDIVRQTTLVLFHPCIHWDRINRLIVWNDFSRTLSNTLRQIKEATDDDFEKILIEVNKRNSQSKFREKLLDLYENKCAISGVAIKEVLEAAHIFEHSNSGINASANGLLLRSDLHKLFDAGLLRIDPSSKKVILNEILKSTVYSDYENKTLAARSDGSEISTDFLREKWNSFD